MFLNFRVSLLTVTCRDVGDDHYEMEFTLSFDHIIILIAVKISQVHCRVLLQYSVHVIWVPDEHVLSFYNTYVTTQSISLTTGT